MIADPGKCPSEASQAARHRPLWCNRFVQSAQKTKPGQRRRRHEPVSPARKRPVEPVVGPPCRLMPQNMVTGPSRRTALGAGETLRALSAITSRSFRPSPSSAWCCRQPPEALLLCTAAAIFKKKSESA